MSTNPATITLDNLVEQSCPHCQTATVQVSKETAAVMVPVPTEGDQAFVNQHCLQCIADGGTCCNLKDFTRYA